MLSVSRASLTTAEEAFRLHVACLELASTGTWGVTIEECGALELQARPDVVLDGPCPDPAHAIIDFAGLSNSKVAAHGARLAHRANERGCLYRSEETGGT
jgi:hypothetical protein